jgi:hypothetical protein|tara:strand:- start:568 stop:993 length:426 start_codon:yes stop_codon:yes gene_type:complete
MQLFDLVRVMFTSPQKYSDIKNSDKAKNHFMIQRFMAINFPDRAQLLNRNGINGIGVIDTWQFITSRFKRVPGWIYTKTKKTKKQESLEFKYADDLVDLYLKVNEITKKDFDQLVKLNPEKMQQYFLKLRKQYDTYTSNES